ncbi:MAG TPA: methyltransferase domain-containing protein [Acidimicrobiia bacterium]|nr:methyltransferase domain-containing protein [Acidimicrobiia bacterium]
MTARCDELALAGPEHLDAGFVAGYDRKSGFDPTDDLRVLRDHGIGPASTVVDLGAGTGAFALAAAAAFGRVVAVDVSPAMVGTTRGRVRAAEVTNVEVVQAGFLSYEHAGTAADAVYTRNALHHLPDIWKAIALDRIARLLRPGGVLLVRDLVYDCSPSEFDSVVAHWLDGAVDDPEQGYTRAELAEHVRTEHSTFRWLFEPMLTTAGFEILDVGFRRRVYASYTCVRGQSRKS